MDNHGAELHITGALWGEFVGGDDGRRDVVMDLILLGCFLGEWRGGLLMSGF